MSTAKEWQNLIQTKKRLSAYIDRSTTVKPN